MTERGYGDREAEMLELLAGARPKAIERAAVRLEDLAGLLPLSPKLRAAKAAGATPTKAEFDALVEDVKSMHNRLTAVVEALQNRARR